MAGNVTVTVEEAPSGTDLEILGMGRQGHAASKSINLSTEDLAALNAVTTAIQAGTVATGTAGTPASAVVSVQGVVGGKPAPTINGGSEYETVAASQTAQTLGPAGATGDYLSHLIVVPATTTPGVVTILDNAISIPLFVGGASSVSNLVPFTIAVGLRSVSGAWKVTTGANVSVIAAGDFT